MVEVALTSWILRCIKSCSTIEQLESSMNLVELFYKRTSNLYLYIFLKEKLYEKIDETMT